jgi:hypothetical protein
VQGHDCEIEIAERERTSQSGLPKAILQMSSMLEFSNGGARSISHFPKPEMLRSTAAESSSGAFHPKQSVSRQHSVMSTRSDRN